MTINDENQQQDNDKIEHPTENSIDRSWILQLAPTTVTLIPSDQSYLIESQQGNYVDVVRYGKIQLELQEAKNQLITNELIRRDLIANIGCSLEVPCSGIFALIIVLYEAEENSERKHYIKTILDCAERLLDYSHHLLDFLRRSAEVTTIALEGFNIKELVNNTIAKGKPASISKGLKLCCNFQHDIAEIIIGDHYRLQTILDQLVGNAIKFTSEGGVTVSCSVLKDEEKWQKIEISVNDTGVGMEPNYLNTIFSKFSQEDKSISRRFGGTGLGMAITYELVLLMKGNITVKSEKNKGTTFFVQLTLPKGNKQNIENKKHTVSRNEIENLKVLLVEDNEMNRIVAQNTLNYFGCITTEAINGLEAIEILRDNNFDVILMDIQMPEMDGIEATKYIRSKLNISTPIIALTANAFKTEIELCKLIGMNDYVTKPFEESTLINTIAKNVKIKLDLSKLDSNQVIQSENNFLYNLDKLKAMSRGNNDFVLKMISLFISQTNLSIEQFSTALSNYNYIEVSNIAHKIKPSIDNMGITLMTDNIRELEKVALEATDIARIDWLVNYAIRILKETNSQLMKLVVN